MERVEMRDKTNRANPQSEAPTNPGKKSHKYLPSNKEMGSLGSAGPTGNSGPVGVSWQGNLSSGSVKIGKTDRKGNPFNDLF